MILAYARQDEQGFQQGVLKHPVDRWQELVAQRELAKSFIQEQFHDANGRNLRAYHSYPEPVSFAQRLHTHLQGVLEELLGVDAAPTWLSDPYRGLQFFDVEHAPIFHGRDEETCDILQRLRERAQSGCSSVVIVGASGSGKSSLARAGVAAALTQHAYDEQVKTWRVVPFFPSLGGSDLATSLTRTLAEQLPELRNSATALEDIAAGLAKDPTLTIKLSLAPAFARAAEAEKGVVKLLLLVDQLEELWTDRRITAEDRSKFLDLLETLARCGHVAVLATLRSDFYPHAQREPAFLRLKEGQGHCDLLPPGAAALQRLITEPPRLAGLTFEREEKTGRTLDQLILQDASRDPAALPLLQYALSELYQQRELNRTLTFAAYQAMGGVEGGLGKRAAATFDSLPEDARAALPEILPLLVTVDVAGEQSAVRRRALLSDLTSTPARATLTESLIAARFLTTDREGETPIASLAHEALLRRWEQLATWVADNRDHLRIRARVEHSQHHWDQQHRDPSLLLSAGLPLEEGKQLLAQAKSLLSAETTAYLQTSISHHTALQFRARRLRRAVMSGMIVLTVVALVGGVTAWFKQREADFNATAAKASATTAGKEKTEAQRQEKIADENAKRATENARLTSEANDHQRALLHRASQADYASALKVWQEDDTARQNGGWAPSLPGISKWHEAVALCLRALESEPANRQASEWLSFKLWQMPRFRQSHHSGKPLRHKNRVNSASFSPDGTRVVTASFDKTARVWDAASSKPIGEPLRHDGAVNSASFSPDGTRVVTASFDKTARVWDAASGQPLGEPLRHKDIVRSASFSPDGTRVVTASEDKTARMWDAASSKPIGEPLRHDGAVNSASFSPDGTRVVTANDDKTAQMWDAASSKPIGEPLRHDGAVNSASFSPDGTRVVTASEDKTARM